MISSHYIFRFEQDIAEDRQHIDAQRVNIPHPLLEHLCRHGIPIHNRCPGVLFCPHHRPLLLMSPLNVARNSLEQC